MDVSVDQDPTASYRLLVNVAEQLKLPFLQIQKQAELTKITGKTDIDSIQTSANYALELLDNYLLALRLSHEHL